MKYDDKFDLHIDPKISEENREQYHLRLKSPTGETKESILQELPADEDFKDSLFFFQDETSNYKHVERVGEKICDFLFPQEIRDHYFHSLRATKAQGSHLRIRLHINATDTELNQIPWEYCSMASQDPPFLALRKDISIFRYIYTGSPPEIVSIPEMKILVAIATPDDRGKIDMHKEVKGIVDALSSLDTPVEFEILPNATRTQLQNRFLNFDPHLVHFIGHGEVNKKGEGQIILEDEKKTSDPMNAREFATLLNNNGVKLVILNACKTAAKGENKKLLGVAHQLVLAGIPAVIGMQFKVPDDKAIHFTKTLYENLVRGESLDMAVTEARTCLYDTDEYPHLWGIPVLFMRVPDGVIWQRSDTESRSTFVNIIIDDRDDQTYKLCGSINELAADIRRSEEDLKGGAKRRVNVIFLDGSSKRVKEIERGIQLLFTLGPLMFYCWGGFGYDLAICIESYLRLYDADSGVRTGKGGTRLELFREEPEWGRGIYVLPEEEKEICRILDISDLTEIRGLPMEMLDLGKKVLCYRTVPVLLHEFFLWESRESEESSVRADRFLSLSDWKWTFW